MSRTIFNELGENRVINPRSGSSVFVDLSSNQIIGAIKRFLNNLITNSDVNFNTTANVGRIVFNPNEPAGSGSQIVSIYTEDENDGNSWIFDSDGNLYYLATGLQPIKIFFSATGEITSSGNINCGNILKTNTIQTNAPFGVIDVLSNIYLKASFFVQDPTNNGTRVLINPSSSAPGEILFTLFKNNTGSNKSLNFNCDGSLYYNDGGSIWKFYENGNLITEGFLQSDKIQSNYFIGVRPFIKLDNRFIDTGNSSLDIITTYVGFPHPSQTLTTASKYMYIQSLSTGNFEMLISNIANKILSSDWATTKINSQYIWSINNIINQNAIILNGLATGSGNRLEIFGTAGGVRKLYYNTDNELGVIETVTTFWKITGAGAITCASLNASSGIIQTTGSVLTNTINPVSGTTISTNSIWNFKTVGGTYTPILLDPTTTSGNRLKIDGTLGGTRYLFFNTSSNIGVFNTATGANVWSIDGVTGNINTIGTMVYSTLTATSLLTNSISPISPSTTIDFGITSSCKWLKSAGNNRIVFRPQSTTDDILQIYQTGSNTADGFLYFNNNGYLGYFITSSSSWTISKAGNAIFSQINCSGLTCTTIQTNGNTIACGIINSSNINSSGTINCGGITCSTIQTNNNTITCGNINSSGNVSAPSMNITNNSNYALTLNSGGIHLVNNNWLFGRCKFGDADYAYVAEYDTGDSDKLYLFGSNGIYCNSLPVVVSDKRLKENIEDFIIDNPLEIIDKIRLVEYNRIDNPSKTRVLGYIAQEILEIFPKAVEIDQTVVKKDENSVLFKKHNDGTDSEEPEREERLALNYSYISMLNTEAIKQLNELVQKQQILIDSLISRLDKLEN